MQIEHVVREPVGEPKSRPVLLLHGAWHGAWCYDRWLDDFAAHGYETHAMSLPGHGGSSLDKPLLLYGIGDYVRALADVIEQIRPRPFVVAHSMGGYVLQRYLHRHELPGAVLLASVTPAGVLGLFWRMFMRHPLTFLSGLLTTRNRRWVGTPALVQEYFLTDHPVCSPTEVAGRLVNDSMRVGVEMLFGLRGNPRRVMTPILVVAAEYDALLPQAGQWQMAQAYGAEFRLIPRQGHDLMIEREWQQTAATIRVWLERLKPWLVDD